MPHTALFTGRCPSPPLQQRAGCGWRGSGRGGRAGRAGALRARAAGEYETLRAQGTVYRAADGAAVQLASLWPPQKGTKCVVAFLTHWADLSSTEFAEKLQTVLPQLRGAGVGVVAVGLGEPEKARRFAELLEFPLDVLYADPTGDLYRALGFNPGFLPDSTSVPAYAKLLAMLAGVGSPGTIPEVLRGYAGDRAQPPVFSGESNLFDVLGKGYQRPFELATLRLQNMNLVLSHWNELAPADERLLTQQGGCLVFDGQDLVYKHADSGILKFAPVDQVLAAALPGAGKPAAQVDRSFKLL